MTRRIAIVLALVFWGSGRLAQAQSAASPKTVLDKVFSLQQSTRGAQAFEENCVRCHEGVRLTQELGVPAGRVTTYMASYHGLASELGSTVVANCASCHTLPGSGSAHQLAGGRALPTPFGVFFSPSRRCICSWMTISSGNSVGRLRS